MKQREAHKFVGEDIMRVQSDWDASHVLAHGLFSGNTMPDASGELIRAASTAELKHPGDRMELLEAIRELTALRDSDHRAARLKMDLRRWEEEQAKLESDAHYREVWEPINTLNMFRNRESYVQMVASEMTPEQEQSLRDYLKMTPRNRPQSGTPTSGPPSTSPSA